VSTNLTPSTDDLLNWLYSQLDGLYPWLWRSRFPTEESMLAWRTAWAAGFTAEGVSPEEIRAGLAKCRNLHAVPPSFTEFLRACRPPLDRDAAYEEAVAQMRRRRESGTDQWSNPAIYWAAASMFHDLMQRPYYEVRDRWGRALEKAQADVRAGLLPPSVPEKPKAIPAPPAAASPEHAQKIRGLLDGLRQKLTAEPPEGL